MKSSTFSENYYIFSLQPWPEGCPNRFPLLNDDSQLTKREKEAAGTGKAAGQGTRVRSRVISVSRPAQLQLQVYRPRAHWWIRCAFSPFWLELVPESRFETAVLEGPISTHERSSAHARAHASESERPRPPQQVCGATSSPHRGPSRAAATAR